MEPSESTDSYALQKTLEIPSHISCLTLGYADHLFVGSGKYWAYVRSNVLMISNRRWLSSSIWPVVPQSFKSNPRTRIRSVLDHLLQTVKYRRTTRRCLASIWKPCTWHRWLDHIWGLGFYRDAIYQIMKFEMDSSKMIQTADDALSVIGLGEPNTDDTLNEVRAHFL